MPSHACFGSEVWSPLVPRVRLLELRGELHQKVVSAVWGDELHSDRQSVRGDVRGSEMAGSPVVLNG